MNGLSKIEFQVKGMTCGSCVSHVEKFLEKLPNVSNVEVNLATEKAKVEFVPKTEWETRSESEVKALMSAAIQEAGYEAVFFEPSELEKIEEAKKKEIHDLSVKVLVSALLTLPLVGPMILMPFGIHWMLPVGIQLALTLPVQLWAGFRFYRGAWAAIKRRSGNMDLLVALGTTAAFSLSFYSMIRGQNHIYFESAASVITLVLLGKWLEARAKEQTTNAIRALKDLTPKMAKVLRGPKGNEKELEILVDQIFKGDVMMVRPGDAIPTDGEIIEGMSTVDESLITGESVAVTKKVGDRVIGGSVNVDGVLKIKVTAIGGETLISRMIQMVENAQVKKAPIQKLVDQVSGVFVPVVIGIALVTLAGWGFTTGNWESAIIHAVAVLVIACPCALGLATPVTLMVGTGIAAQKGILIKDIEALEIAHSVNIVALDKTGTLTLGKPEVVGSWQMNEHSLGVVKALQQGSNHPLAEALLKFVQVKFNQTAPRYLGRQIKVIPGKGVSGLVEGKSYVLGSEALIKESLQGFSQSVSQKLNEEQLQKEFERTNRELGHTLVYLGENGGDQNGKVVSIFALSDQIKPDARDAISTLQKLGVDSIMLTGDHEASARKVAERVGISNFKAGILPEQKLEIIEKLKKEGKITAMVGDGINDAPALTAANLGIAVSTGTDIAMNSAGITLVGGSPMLIPKAIEISKKTYRKIQQNLFWAFVYNVIGIPLAAFGYLNPIFAGLAMALSSVSVVTNALYLKKEIH